MKINTTILLKIAGKKLAVLSLIGVSAVAAFATLGDGKSLDRPKNSKGSLLTNKSQANSFSLRSGYSFRGNQVIDNQGNRFVNLNTVVTYQKGNTTYILPVKRKVLLENVKIDIGNRNLRHN